MPKKTNADKPKNDQQAVQEWLDAVYYSSSCNDEPSTKPDNNNKTKEQE